MIATLTINPALDLSTHISGMVPEKKLRCTAPDYFPGGGGINVSRALARLQQASMPIYVAGGPAGKMISDLLIEEGLNPRSIEVQTWTRENITVKDDANGSQYRFTFPGIPLPKSDENTVMDFMKNIQPFPQFLVLSGSFAPDFSLDFIQDLKALCDHNQSKLIVDTSGPYLKKAVKAGVYLIKPNYHELCELAGLKGEELQDVQAVGRKVIQDFGLEMILVSLGANGASLITKDQFHHIHAPKVPVKSTVGAGDSMLAGVVFALTLKKPLKEVLKWGVACGTATTMNEGTGLFQKDQVETVFGLIR